MKKENKMEDNLTKMTKEQFESVDNSLLTLFAFTLKRASSYDNEEGKKALAIVEQIIKERNIDTVSAMRELLPKEFGNDRT